MASYKHSGMDDLRGRMEALKDLKAPQSAREASTAQNILHTDLGYHNDEVPIYNIDEGTRDRLIVHTRQDAAHAVITSITNGEKLDSLNVRINVLTFLAIALIGIMTWQIFM